MRNASGYDLVLLVLKCLKKIVHYHREMPAFQGGETVHTRIADTMSNIFVCYELLGCFGGKWQCPDEQTVGVDGDIFLGVTDSMRSFGHSLKIQTRGCAVLSQLALLNQARFNHKQMPHIMCALQMMQSKALIDVEQLIASRALLSFIVLNGNKQLCDTRAQDTIGATGAVPILLTALKQIYDKDTNKAAQNACMVGILDVLVAITNNHKANCRLLYLADGVTLVMGVVSARGIKKITEVETAGVSLICNVFSRIGCYDSVLKEKVLLRARTRVACHSTDQRLKAMLHNLPISAIIATASKKPVPAVVITRCLTALISCAKAPANRAIIGTTGVSLAVTLDKAGHNRLATVLLSWLTTGGAYCGDRGIANIATRTTLPKNTLDVNLDNSDIILYKEAQTTLQKNVKMYAELGATLQQP